MIETLPIKRLTLAFSFFAILTAVLGILISHLSIAFSESVNQNSRTIAFSAALIWIFFCSLLAYQTIKPLNRLSSLVTQSVIVLIAAVEAIEFSLSIQGNHFFVETLFVSAGTIVIGPSSSPISPVAAFLAIIVAIALILLIRNPEISDNSARIADVISILGLIVSVISFTFILSYAYNDPLLYGSQYIPIAFSSALSAFFTGIAVVIASGHNGIPLKYMIGNSINSGLLRVFVPLVAGVILFENVILVELSSIFNIRNSVILSFTLVVFTIATAFVVARISGRIGGELEQAKQELIRKNRDLNRVNEKLTEIEEELRSNFEDLILADKKIQESEEKFRTVFEHTPLGMATCDLNGHIIDVNPAFENMIGFSQDELYNKSFLEFTHPCDRAIEWALLCENIAGEINHADIEKRYIRKDGQVIWIRLIASIIHGVDRKPYLGIALVEDITKRKHWEEELKKSHNDLNALNKEINATQMVLQQKVEDLGQREHQLNEALAEKEVLLSEVHHRVKNNLTAFISLLSLGGSYEDTEGGKALRKDLQNRARSMALIHETLYKTGKFSNVDMEIYLTNLINQIACSYKGSVDILTEIYTNGIVLDLARATTTGLIINELVTNSYKYAFPPDFNSLKFREPCRITVSLTHEDGKYILSVSDNGRGLPPDFNPLTARSLGLKLVNFLARHQLRAGIEVRNEKGTEFIFRLDNIEENS